MAMWLDCGGQVRFQSLGTILGIGKTVFIVWGLQ